MVSASEDQAQRWVGGRAWALALLCYDEQLSTL